MSTSVRSDAPPFCVTTDAADGFADVSMRVAFRMRLVDRSSVSVDAVDNAIVLPPPLGLPLETFVQSAVLPQLARLRQRTLVMVPESLVRQEPPTPVACSCDGSHQLQSHSLVELPSPSSPLSALFDASASTADDTAAYSLADIVAGRVVEPRRLGQRPDREVDVLPRANNAAESTLLEAAETGSLERVRSALAEGASPAARSAIHGGTALHLAVSRGNARIASLLLERGAACDALAANGSTPCMWAAGAGHSDCVELLLDAGADPLAVSWTWERCTFGRGSGQSAAHWASESNQTDAVRTLLTRAPELVAALDERDRSPLALAQVEGSFEVEEILEDAAATRYILVEVEPSGG